jgi:hypothetical protein
MECFSISPSYIVSNSIYDNKVRVECPKKKGEPLLMDEIFIGESWLMGREQDPIN